MGQHSSNIVWKLGGAEFLDIENIQKVQNLSSLTALHRTKFRDFSTKKRPFSTLETTIPLCGGTGFFCVFSGSTLVGLRSWTRTEMTHLTRITALSTLFPPENRPWNWRFRLFAHLKYCLLSQKISIFRNLSIKVALLRWPPDRLQNDEKLAFEQLFDCNSPVSGTVILGQPFTRRNCRIRSSKWAIFWANWRKFCPP